MKGNAMIALGIFLASLTFISQFLFTSPIRNEGASELEKLICFQNRTGQQCLCCQGNTSDRCWKGKDAEIETMACEDARAWGLFIYPKGAKP